LLEGFKADVNISVAYETDNV
jgi:hypothetical protein